MALAGFPALRRLAGWVALDRLPSRIRVATVVLLQALLRLRLRPGLTVLAAVVVAVGSIAPTSLVPALQVLPGSTSDRTARPRAALVAPRPLLEQLAEARHLGAAQVLAVVAAVVVVPVSRRRVALVDLVAAVVAVVALPSTVRTPVLVVPAVRVKS